MKQKVFIIIFGLLSISFANAQTSSCRDEAQARVQYLLGVTQEQILSFRAVSTDEALQIARRILPDGIFEDALRYILAPGIITYETIAQDPQSRDTMITMLKVEDCSRSKSFKQSLVPDYSNSPR